jgi:hypothetical protein
MPARGARTARAVRPLLLRLAEKGIRYWVTAEGAFGADVDHAQLVKLYGAVSENAKGRYSPAECIGAR